MRERATLEHEFHELELTWQRGLTSVLERLQAQRRRRAWREYDVNEKAKLADASHQQLHQDDQLLLLFDPATSYIRPWEVQATVSAGLSAVGVKVAKDQGAMRREKTLKFAKRFVTPLLKTSAGAVLFGDVAGGFGLDAQRNRVRDRFPRRVLIAWATDKTRFGGTGTAVLQPKDAKDPTKGSESLILIDERGKDWDAFPEFKSRPDIVLFHELFHARRNQTGARTDDAVKEEKLAIIEENHYRNAIGEKITDVSERLKGQFI